MGETWGAAAKPYLGPVLPTTTALGSVETECGREELSLKRDTKEEFSTERCSSARERIFMYIYVWRVVKTLLNDDVDDRVCDDVDIGNAPPPPHTLPISEPNNPLLHTPPQATKPLFLSEILKPKPGIKTCMRIAEDKSMRYGAENVNIS